MLYGIYRRATTGADHDELVDKTGDNIRALDWSRDGRYVVEDRPYGTTSRDIWILPLFGDKEPFLYVHNGPILQFARISPNGEWLAYDAGEFSRVDIYVQTFPKPGRKWQISTKGGSHPVWSRDGSELYFINPDRRMMAVKIKGGPNFEHDAPQDLFDTRFTGGTNAWFDVSKDGRFLIPTEVERPANTLVTITVNWAAALKK